MHLLTPLIADALELHLAAREAHWNVRGPNFLSLHELFDRVSTELEAHADALAERVRTLGGEARAQSRWIAVTTSQPAYPNGTKRHVAELASRLARFSAACRRSIDPAQTGGDAVTADLLTEIAGEVDKVAWLVESHERER